MTPLVLTAGGDEAAVTKWNVKNRALAHDAQVYHTDVHHESLSILAWDHKFFDPFFKQWVLREL